MPTERKDWHGRPALTIEELEAMSPEERRADSESRLVTDLSQVPEGDMDDLRAWLTPQDQGTRPGGHCVAAGPVTHRFVTFTSSFFADLDRQLPVQRSSQLPSRTDFLDYELSTIRERFSHGFDDLPVAIPGRPDPDAW